MSRLRTNDANVESQVKKMLGLSVAVAFPATRPGKAILGFAGRRALLAVEGIVMDPIGSMQRTNALLNTYKRIGQAVALYESLSRIGDSYQSLSSSSSSYQQNGGGSDTPSRAEVALAIGFLGYKVHEFATEKHYPKHPYVPCREGFVEKRVNGKLMCVRSTRK